MNPEPLIAITGSFDPTSDELTVTYVQRVDAVRTLEGEPSGMSAELIGEDGEVMSRAPLQVLPSSAHGSGPCNDCGGEHAVVVQALVPDTGPGGALRVIRGDEAMWWREATDRPPEIGGFRAEASKEGLRAEWEADGGDELEFGLRWSRDPDGPWNSLAFGLTERSATLAKDTVPAGEVYVQLIVHDGFFSTTSEPVAVGVEGSDLAVAILSPVADLPVHAGRPLRLWAAISAKSGDPVGDARVVWLIDGEEVGDAVDVWVAAPEPGDHEVTLRVGAETGEATAHASLTTYGE